MNAEKDIMTKKRYVSGKCASPCVGASFGSPVCMPGLQRRDDDHLNAQVGVSEPRLGAGPRRRPSRVTAAFNMTVACRQPATFALQAQALIRERAGSSDIGVLACGVISAPRAWTYRRTRSRLRVNAVSWSVSSGSTMTPSIDRQFLRQRKQETPPF